MAIKAYSGFENGAGLSVVDEAILTGTTSFDTGIVRSGTYSVRCNPTTVDAGGIRLAYPGSNGVYAIGTSINDLYTQFYFYIATLPASSAEFIFSARTPTANNKLSTKITSTGKLQIFDTNNVQIGSDGTTTLSTGQWYQIRIRVGTGASATYSLSINGTSEFSGTANLSTEVSQDIYYGKWSDSASQSVDFYFDDIIEDDATFPSGAVKIVALRPVSNGSTMSFTSGTGASDYTQVDEVPPDDADYVMSPTTGNPNTALFYLQTLTTLGISASSILALKINTRTRENSSVSSASLLRIKSSSSNLDSTTLNGTTSIAYRGLVALVDPATSTAWTSSGVNAVEIGVLENNAVSTRCTYVAGMLAYIPAVGPTNIKSYNTNVFANIKSIDTNAIANVKSLNTNT